MTQPRFFCAGLGDITVFARLRRPAVGAHIDSFAVRPRFCRPLGRGCSCQCRCQFPAGGLLRRRGLRRLRRPESWIFPSAVGVDINNGGVRDRNGKADNHCCY